MCGVDHRTNNDRNGVSTNQSQTKNNLTSLVYVTIENDPRNGNVYHQRLIVLCVFSSCLKYKLPVNPIWDRIFYFSKS